MRNENIIKEKSFNFALDIIQLYKDLVKEKEYVIARQILKSGTSIGANVEEAGAGQSRKDFISKMSIASKEARETLYWLKLLKRSNLVQMDLSRYLDQSDQLVRILTSIVKTSSKPNN